MTRLLCITALCLGFALQACESGNPVAPSATEQPTGDTVFNVTLTASPARLQAGSGQASLIDITVRQASDNRSPADGTSITVTTDLGSFGVNDPASPVKTSTLTLTAGAVQVSLFPGDQAGTAMVLAQVGQSIGTLELEILEVLPSNFFVIGVSPNVGDPDGGEEVTIQGQGFQAPLRVDFAGAQAEVVALESAESILVRTPPSAMPVATGQVLLVDVSVANALNEASPATDTLAGAFTYTREAPPAFFLTEVTPSSGSSEGGTAITILGGGIRTPVRVEIGGVVASVTATTSTEISLDTPASATPVAPGTTLPVDVTVTHALDDAPEMATLTGGFTYIAGPEVVVSSLDPSSGPFGGGTQVSLQGQGFEDPVTVEIAGVRQQNETATSSTVIDFTTSGISLSACPASGTVPQMVVRVVNLGSGLSGSADLIYTYTVPLPRIERVAPTVGSQPGNALVSLEGDNFSEPVRVVFSRDGQEFAAVVQSTTATLVQVASPSVPDDFFPEEDCVTGDGEAGKRYLSASADVRLVNIETGCSDTFGNAFTYNPTSAGCRVVAAAARGR